MAKVLVIDNYDSFVYNLVQYFSELKAEVIVWRNDAYPDSDVLAQISKLEPSHIMISPGPGRPEDSGISRIIIKELAGKLPILGVCLGHQAIGEMYGAKVVNAPTLMHGKTSQIKHQTKHPLFKDIPSPYTATRYHSLTLDKTSVENSAALQIEAESEDGVVMAVSHKDIPQLVGVQYHPESILSEYGHKLLQNFLELN